MPTKTFYNLPREKREKLLRAAAEEFSRRPYGEASINRVIRAAEIPRGSFYQYFSDKTDLFFTVLRHYGAGMEELIRDVLRENGGDLLAGPLTLFDRIMAEFDKGGEEIRRIMAILRCNVGLDLSRVWDLMAEARQLLEGADMSRLNLRSWEEQYALLELLLSAIAKAVAAVCCGMMTPEESRRQLAYKVALLRRGVEKQEDFSC